MKQTAPADLFTLPREEFRKDAKVQCEIRDCVEQMLKVYGERKPPLTRLLLKRPLRTLGSARCGKITAKFGRPLVSR